LASDPSTDLQARRQNVTGMLFSKFTARRFLVAREADV
jgi:hypothetical protein